MSYKEFAKELRNSDPVRQAKLQATAAKDAKQTQLHVEQALDAFPLCIPLCSCATPIGRTAASLEREESSIDSDECPEEELEYLESSFFSFFSFFFWFWFSSANFQNPLRIVYSTTTPVMEYLYPTKQQYIYTEKPLQYTQM